MGSEGGKKGLIVMEVVEEGGGDDDMSYGLFVAFGLYAFNNNISYLGERGWGRGGM